MMNERERVAERLRAYIHPNVAETDAQEAAFDAAVDAQLTHEQAWNVGEIPEGVKSFSVGNYSVTLDESADTGARGGICPAARAILFNAGLLRRAMPVAKRL